MGTVLWDWSRDVQKQQCLIMSEETKRNSDIEQCLKSVDVFFPIVVYCLDFFFLVFCGEGEMLAEDVQRFLKPIVLVLGRNIYYLLLCMTCSCFSINQGQNWGLADTSSRWKRVERS